MALTDLTKVSSSGIAAGVSIDGHSLEANGVNVSGIVTATEFHGDGSNLTNVSAGAAGISTALVIAYAVAL